MNRSPAVPLGTRTRMAGTLNTISWGDMRKCTLFEPQNNRKPAMEAERINAIRNSLTDLTERVAELRRYL